MLRYWVVILVLVPWSALMASLALLGGLIDRSGNWGGFIARLWSALILKISGVKARVRGLGRLDPEGQYIFMSNHTSAFDIPLLFYYLPYQLRMIAKRELAWIPIFGWAMWVVRHYFVNRRNHRKALELMTKVGEQFKHRKSSIVVFPEGTRSLDGRVKTFKKGGFILALQTGAPIVPVLIQGTFQIKPKYRRAIRPGIADLVILPPVPTVGLGYGDRDNLVQQVHAQFEGVNR